MTTKSLATAVLVFMAVSCATVSTKTNHQEMSRDTVIQAGQYSGPRKRVQVIEVGIPDSLLRTYPELVEKRVGWGLTNRLIESFYETARFEFIEEKDAILNRILSAWKLSMSGAVSEETQIQTEGLRAPEYLLYAEVYEFSVGVSERVAGVAAKKDLTTRIGVQIRLVDTRTGSYIPASGIGESTTFGQGTIWAFDDMSFNQSTVGRASQLAVITAVNQLLKRISF